MATNLPPYSYRHPASNSHSTSRCRNSPRERSTTRLHELITRGDTIERTVSLELPSNVYIPAADIVMVVDESGSMEEQSWIASMVQALETELDSRNIDDTRFAIVGFGGPNSLPHVVKETPIMKCGCMVRVVDSCSGPSSKKDSRYAWLNRERRTHHRHHAQRTKAAFESNSSSLTLRRLSLRNPNSKPRLPRNERLWDAVRCHRSRDANRVLFEANAGDLIFVDRFEGENTTLCNCLTHTPPQSVYLGWVIEIVASAVCQSPERIVFV